MGIQMEKFMAASGRVVLAGEDGSLMFGKALGYLSREAAFDAEEYFQAKRDEELGWWRWPQNPSYVVRPLAGQVLVIDERTGRSHVFGREDDSGVWALADAAEVYFEAHPEVKPWHDAAAGEVWLLTVDGHEAHFVADGKEFNGTNEFGRFICCSHDDEDITAGRRVWPEVAA